LAVLAVSLAWTGPAAAAPNLVLADWRVEPSTVKENEPWTVKMWIANLGNDRVKKAFTVVIRECDKQYAKCDTTWASQEVKPSEELVPGKLPGSLVVIKISKGLAKGEHFIQLVVDAKNEVNEKPVTKNVRVPVGFYKY
jgi:hypothetical protein